MVRVVFLSTCTRPAGFRNDPAFIYRCENLGHALRAKGLDVEWDHVFTWRRSNAPSCAVIHRPRLGFRTWRLVRHLKAMGARLVADIDDLVFDEAYARFSPAVRNGRSQLWRLQRRFRDQRAAIKWFDHITVSTDALRDHAHRCFPGKPVTVLHNAVHWEWLRRPHQAAAAEGPVKTITYLPGTRSHDRDFALIAEPLTRFLRTHLAVRLRITGPLGFRLEVPAGQLQTGEKVAFSDYHEQFRDAWVNLAPLEDTPFNHCKSALKVMEAGYWGVPTICSPNPDYQRFETAGALPAGSASEWLQRLEQLVDDRHYRRLKENLRERTLQLADVNARADQFLGEVLGQAGR